MYVLLQVAMYLAIPALSVFIATESSLFSSGIITADCNTGYKKKQTTPSIIVKIYYIQPIMQMWTDIESCSPLNINFKETTTPEYRQNFRKCLYWFLLLRPPWIAAYIYRLYQCAVWTKLKKNRPVTKNILQQLGSRIFASSKFYVKRF